MAGYACYSTPSSALSMLFANNPNLRSVFQLYSLSHVAHGKMMAPATCGGQTVKCSRTLSKVDVL
jgi:hypothetical protein